MAWSPDPRDLEGGSRPTEAVTAALARAARYSRWDGRQAVPDVAADELLDALSEDLLEEGDLGDALRRLMERGIQHDDPTRPDMAGLRDLLDRLAKRREELLARYKLGDVLSDTRAELAGIIDAERAGVERRLAEASWAEGSGVSPSDARPGDSSPEDASPADASSSEGSAEASNDRPGLPSAPGPALVKMARDLAARRREQLDALPSDVGGQIRGLREYDFLEPEARRRFDELVERLQRQVLDQYVQGLSDAIKGVTPEDLAANGDMVRDLNPLLEERLDGRDPDVSEFLARHGRFFPGARTLDDIIGQLGERMSAMQSLLRSMTPGQRRELQSMMDALLRDDRLRRDLAQLGANLDQLLPGGLGERFSFGGDETLGIDGALEQIARLQAMDGLEGALVDAEGPEGLAAIDRAQVRDLLGEESARQLDALGGLAQRLEEAGYLQRRGDRLELTPRGSRRIGQNVLEDLFAGLRRDAFGGHRLQRSGRGGDRDEATKPYEFGDPFALDLRETLFKALGRPGNVESARTGGGVRLTPGDFEVYRQEQLTNSATVLLLDMSRSMLLRGCFLAAKKVAIALEALIRTQFPRDYLGVVGFAYYAREIKPEILPELTWQGYEYGTNLQHGLLLARRMLARRHAANKEILVITDGEPTAHFEDGRVEFSYPPTRRTIQETLREVGRCTNDGIVINTFMLEQSRALGEFVALMTRRNRGRAFYSSPDRLGEYVLVDFVKRRTTKKAG